MSNLIGIEEEDFYAGVDSRVTSKVIANPKLEQIEDSSSERFFKPTSPS